MSFRLGPKAISFGYRLASFETIGSTNAEALERAKAGDPGRLWVVSGAQTAGHGRRGRPWATPSGNLAASLLLAGSVPAATAATLGFAAGLAVLEAIDAATAQSNGAALESLRPSPPPQGERGFPSGRIQLKWPNDVVMDGRKLAGILMEAVSTPGGESRIVIGIGVNVAHAPEGLPYPATSLAAYGARVRAEELFETLSDCWVYHERIWEEGRGFSEVRHRWLKRAAGVGLPIAVRMGEDLFRGVFETIDSDGRLVLRTPDGFPKTITAGDVHFGLAATAGI